MADPKPVVAPPAPAPVSVPPVHMPYVEPVNPDEAPVMVQHTSEQNFEPTNEEKDARNRSAEPPIVGAEPATAAPEPWRVARGSGDERPDDANYKNEQRNKTPEVVTGAVPASSTEAAPKDGDKPA